MISNILMIDFSYLSSLDTAFRYFYFELVGIFLTLGLLFELITNGDGNEAIKRALSGFLIVSVAFVVQTTLVKASLGMADRGYSEMMGGRPAFFGGDATRLTVAEYKRELERYQYRNDDNGVQRSRYSKAFIELIGVARFYGSIFANAGGHAVDSTILHVSRVIVIICFIFIKVAYTSIFVVNLILLPFPALATIIPFTKSSISTPISTLLWLMIQPFTVGAIIFAMDLILAETLTGANTAGTRLGFETCLMMICFSVMLIASIGITGAIVSGSGLAQAVGQTASLVPAKGMMLGKMAAGAALTGGAALLGFIGSGKVMNLGGNLARLAANAAVKSSSGGGGGSGQIQESATKKLTDQTTKDEEQADQPENEDIIPAEKKEGLSKAAFRGTPPNSSKNPSKDIVFPKGLKGIALKGAYKTAKAVETVGRAGYNTKCKIDAAKNSVNQLCASTSSKDDSNSSRFRKDIHSALSRTNDRGATKTNNSVSEIVSSCNEAEELNWFVDHQNERLLKASSGRTKRAIQKDIDIAHERMNKLREAHNGVRQETTNGTV